MQKYVRPFLKWAGSKYTVLNYILPRLKKGKRLIEPFVGSGAVFLNSQFSEFLLCDINSDLILVYNYLQKEKEKFIKYALKNFQDNFNNKDTFYDLRDKFNNSKRERERAALFLYLNRHCYNGLCRYNSKGKFNVPFGQYNKVNFPYLAIQHFINNYSKAKFILKDFKSIFNDVNQGDIVYCDPPYVPLSATSKFTSYTASSFNEKEQIELAQLAENAASQGATVLISNHDLKFTRDLYKNAKIISFKVQRNVSSKLESRIQVGELLAIYSKK